LGLNGTNTDVTGSPRLPFFSNKLSNRHTTHTQIVFSSFYLSLIVSVVTISQYETVVLGVTLVRKGFAHCKIWVNL